MKNTSKTMYRVGRIVNVLLLIAGVLLTLLGLICVIIGAAGEAIGDGTGEQELSDAVAGLVAAGSSCLGYGIFLFVGAILAFIFVGKAMRELANEQSHNKMPYILTIIFGAIGENVFFVLAGIFGIIAESQEAKQQNENVIDAKPADDNNADKAE